MAKEFDMAILFCPECKAERGALNKFCGKCGTRIHKVDVIICMEEGKVTRILIKGQE